MPGRPGRVGPQLGFSLPLKTVCKRSTPASGQSSTFSGYIRIWQPSSLPESTFRPARETDADCNTACWALLLYKAQLQSDTDLDKAAGNQAEHYFLRTAAPSIKHCIRCLSWRLAGIMPTALHQWNALLQADPLPEIHLTRLQLFCLQLTIAQEGLQVFAQLPHMASNA